MKINFLYDQGSAPIPEDGIIFCPPCYYGVSDGVSGIYLPHESPKLFAGRTGGQSASYILSLSFGAASYGESLEKILRRANNILRGHNEASGLSLQESELLPSAAFAVTSLSKQKVSIIQGGDSLAVWQMKDGTIGGTPNLAFAYEKRQISTIAKLMEKHRGNRQKMWEEFRPILINDRRTSINRPKGNFSLLNGQPQFKDFLQKFSFNRKEMASLILFSDGLIPFEWSQTEIIMAKKIMRLYKKGGLKSILENTREIAEKNKQSSHEDYPEATALAIEF